MAGLGIGWLHVSVVALAVSVSAPVSAFAQAGALAGQVLDTAGDPLPGVTVEVTDPLLIDPPRRSVTNAQGRYRIPDLRPGLHHTVTFKLPGFSTVARDVELSAGATTVVDAELSVGSDENTRGSTLTMRGFFVLNCESRPDGTIGPCRRSFFGNPYPEHWLPPPPSPVPTENLIRTVRVTDRADVGPANDGNVSIAAVHSVNVDEWLASFDVPPAAARRARSSGGDRPWRSSGRVTMVAVVQAAHVRHRHDLARCSRLDASAHGRILAQREMRAPEMVVVDVRSQYSVE